MRLNIVWNCSSADSFPLWTALYIDMVAIFNRYRERLKPQKKEVRHQYQNTATQQHSIDWLNMASNVGKLYVVEIFEWMIFIEKKFVSKNPTTANHSLAN